MARRKVYLEPIPLDEALQKFFGALEARGLLRPLSGELVPVDAALGRVTARPVWAALSNPHYNAAAMDGIAVRAEDTRAASETAPVRLRAREQFQWVDTGDPILPPLNAVVMLEHLYPVGEEEIEIHAPVPPWHHVRAMGEDMVATELILPEGHTLTPPDLGAIAGCGLGAVEVRQRPRVAVIPTGSELVPPGRAVKPGEIIEFNSLMLCGMVREWGGEANRTGIVPDDFPAIRAAVEEAVATHDVVVINAGSSAGSEDFTAAIVGELGELLVHGIAIRPGHPVVLGIVRGRPVIGIPGYPVSAVITCDLLVKPILYRLEGRAVPERPTLTATMTRKILSPLGEDEFLRVKLGRVGNKVVATPLSRGAGVIMSLVRADGIVRIPRFSEGVHAGATVTVELLRRPEEIEKTIVAIGSHDLTLDLLASLLRRRHPDLHLSSTNVGSLAGLLALKRAEAHMAGSHLLDEETGEYNLPYVARLLPGEKVVVLTLVHRDQGLILPKGNPKDITTLLDLAREDVAFVNRQKGAGTRILLEYRLKQLGIDPMRITGYEREEYTHLAVAAAVKAGVADVGLGILGAARALNLDFIPLLKERYDLIIPEPHYRDPLLRPLLDLITSEGFKQEVEALGGYDTSETGRVVNGPAAPCR
ncbi:MAG: putative molybdopterin biosynthesis protein [candidate division NC10 bacterium CSP1-5]|nr:MAG: putative molybdopterin biosynthesis protein [candidate division NC10 bacterium CSP1-5]